MYKNVSRFYITSMVVFCRYSCQRYEKCLYSYSYKCDFYIIYFYLYLGKYKKNCSEIFFRNLVVHAILYYFIFPNIYPSPKRKKINLYTIYFVLLRFHEIRTKLLTNNGTLRAQKKKSNI